MRSVVDRDIPRNTTGAVWKPLEPGSCHGDDGNNYGNTAIMPGNGLHVVPPSRQFGYHRRGWTRGRRRTERGNAPEQFVGPGRRRPARPGCPCERCRAARHRPVCARQVALRGWSVEEGHSDELARSEGLPQCRGLTAPSMSCGTGRQFGLALAPVARLTLDVPCDDRLSCLRCLHNL
jgi:hypothetical protein